MTDKTQATNWELAGIYGRFELDRPLRLAEILIPSVELDGDALYWHFEPVQGKDGPTFTSVRPGPGLLQDFIELAEAPVGKIVSYARRFGVLEICEHGFPACHHLDALTGRCRPRSDRPFVFSEPVDAWRQYAALFRALLNIAANLNSGRPGNAKDWKAVIVLRDMKNEFFQERGLAVDREKLAVMMNVLLREGGVNPLVVWRNGRWLLQFRGGHAIGCGLFGAIVCQLMLAVTGTEGIEICSSCGLGYVPERRPNRERRNYCPTCRENKIPQRDAARDYREGIRKGSTRPVTRLRKNIH